MKSCFMLITIATLLISIEATREVNSNTFSESDEDKVSMIGVEFKGRELFQARPEPRVIPDRPSPSPPPPPPSPPPPPPNPCANFSSSIKAAIKRCSLSSPRPSKCEEYWRKGYCFKEESNSILNNWYSVDNIRDSNVCCCACQAVSSCAGVCADGKGECTFVCGKTKPAIVQAPKHSVYCRQ